VASSSLSSCACGGSHHDLQLKEITQTVSLSFFRYVSFSAANNGHD